MSDPIAEVKSRLAAVLVGTDVEAAVASVRPTLASQEQGAVINWALGAMAWQIARDRQLKIERRNADEEASRRVEVQRKEHEARRIRAEEAAALEANAFERLFADPELMYGRPSGRSVFLSQRPQREQFARWCRSTHGDDAFSDWVERAVKVAVESEPDADGREDREDFTRADWHPDGPTAYYECCRWRKLRGHLEALVEVTAEKTRLRVTAELLGSEFALGDGRKVTWGAAAKADHEQRIEMVSKNAAANIEDAARHRAAVKMLDAAGVDCLSRLPPEGEAA